MIEYNNNRKDSPMVVVCPRWFHLLMPFLIQCGILVVGMLLHWTAISLGPLVTAVESVGDEVTKPTLGRLIYMYSATVLFFVLSILASRFAKRDRVYPAFSLGYFAGVFLWQALGEDAWHFSINGIHMVQLESYAAFPILILLCLLLIYACRNKSFDFGLWCVLLSFSLNWLGHYVLECAYLPFRNLIDEGVFMRGIGVLLGTVLLVLGIVWGLRTKNRKSQMLYSILCFFAIAVFVFGFMES